MLTSEEIAVRKDNSIEVYEFDYFSRGYHAYMVDWPNHLIGEILICQREPSNIHDADAVAVTKETLLNRTIVGHLPKMYSSTLSKFLLLSGSQVSVEVSGKWINRGAG